MNKTIYLLNRSMQHAFAYAAWMICIILMFLFLPEAKAQTQYDQAKWPDGAPYVSPYAIKAKYGAKLLVKLAKVGAVEPRYFQFIVSEEGGGNKALTMAWKKEKAHYELALEDLKNTKEDKGPENTEPKRVRLDRTLWVVVSARKDPSSQMLYYTLINKASQLPLQLSEDADASIPLEIVDGSTDWLWSDTAEAESGSKFDDSVEKVLQDTIRTAIDANTTLYLVKSEDGDVAVKFVNGSSGVPSDAITFEAWEANPIILTAEQINIKLGYEDVTAQNQGTKDSFKFTFSPDVEDPNTTNVMTSYSFKAEAPKLTGERKTGDATDGYVRFQALEGNKETGKYLMVDTAYHDMESNNKYDLQMAVKSIEYPEDAVLKDGGSVADGDLYIGGTMVAKNVYNYSNVVLVQLKRQTNFKPVFYPSTQSLRLQAEMIFKAKKDDLKANKSWWEQMHDAIGSGGGMTILNASVSDYELHWNGTAGYFQPYTNKTKLLDWGTGVEWNKPAAAVSGLSFGDWYSAEPYASPFAHLAFNNVVKLTTLTSDPKHTVLTCDVRDKNDEENAAGYDGLLTYISLEGLVSADHFEPLTLPNDASTITISYANGKWSYKDDGADAVGFNGTIKVPKNSSSTDKLVITDVTGNPILTFDHVTLEPTSGTALAINKGCELTLQGHLTIDIATGDNTYYCINNSGTLTVAPTDTKTSIHLLCYDTAINNTGALNNAWIEWQFVSALGNNGGIEITSNNSSFAGSCENKTFAMPVIAGDTYKLTAKKYGFGSVGQQGKAADGNTYMIYYPAPVKNGVAVFTDVKDAIPVTITQPTDGGSISVFYNDNLLAANDYVPDKATLTCRYNALPGYELDTYTVTPGTDPSTSSDVSTSATYQVPNGATSIAITATFKEKQGVDPAPDPALTVYYTVVIPTLEGATTDPVAGAYEVEAWDSFRFYLTLDADYDQSAPIVTTDRGETLEPRSSDGAYVIQYVRTPVEISIAGIQKNADVASATILSGTRVWTEPSAVCLETDRTEEVRIVSLAGTTVAAFTAQPGTTRQALAPGAYVVKMERTVYKVIVR